MLTALARSAALVALVACLGCYTLGCYTYQPLPLPTPSAGTRVSVQLTDDGSRELGNLIGSGVARVEGDLLEADSAALQLSVRQVEDQRGVSTDWNGERVPIPRRNIASVHRRRLSIGGTALLGSLGAGAMYLLYGALTGNGLFEGSAGSGSSAGAH
jgi:hypothetical protein